MAEASQPHNRGRVVLMAAVCVNLVLGSLYAWSVIGKALVKDWHWSKTDSAKPLAVSTVAFAIMMIFAGRMQDKLGPRLTATLGGLMFGLGLFVSQYMHSPLGMMITYGVIGGVGIGLCYSATTPPAVKWFPSSQKGMVTGLVVAGVGLAAVYVSPLTQYLLNSRGIASTFMILGIGAAAIICLLSQLLTNPPAGYQAGSMPAGPKSPASGGSARLDLDWHEMLRTPQFYVLWTMFVLSAAAGLMLIAHVATIALDQAHWKAGFVAVATLAIFNTLGRIVAGFASDRIGRSQTMMLAFLLQALNMFLFAHYTTPATLVMGTAFAGVCYGAIYTLMPAATADRFGVRNLGVNYGLLFTAFGVAGVLGPILGGLIRDKTQSFTMSYVLSAVLLVIAAAMALLTKAKAPANPPAKTAG